MRCDVDRDLGNEDYTKDVFTESKSEGKKPFFY